MKQAYIELSMIKLMHVPKGSAAMSTLSKLSQHAELLLCTVNAWANVNLKLFNDNFFTANLSVIVANKTASAYFNIQVIGG